MTNPTPLPPTGTNFTLIAWGTVAVLALAGSILFSGAETGIYSLSKLRLRVRTHKGEPAARQLSDWLGRSTYLLEGLLVWQNICNFAFSAAVTTIMGVYGFSELKQGVVSTLLITPVMLIVAEIAPKDLFYAHTDRWTYHLVPTIKWALRLITVVPVLPVITALGRVSTWLIHRGNGAPETVGARQEILSLVDESTATGVLTGTQQDLIRRALRVARITVRDVMIPWNRVVGVPSTISRDGFCALVRRYNVSRMPVLGTSATQVKGIVNVQDVLAGDPARKVSDFLQPPMTLIGEQNVRSAITLMQRARQTIAVVVDRQNRAVGLVTMKDLIEELVGDLENW